MASDTGWTWESAPFQPRLFLRADMASGDRDPSDGVLNTFNALYPKGAYFAETGLVGPANILDLHPGVELHLTPNLSLTADIDFFWRASLQDGLYNNALKLVRTARSGTSSDLGRQGQVWLQWAVSRHFTFSVAYDHFFAGTFLQQGPSGEDVNYVSTWMTFRF